MELLSEGTELKILQVYKDVFPEVNGGIERYIHDLSVYLLGRDHCVEVLVAGGGSRTVSGFAVTGIPSIGRVLSNPLAPGYITRLSGTDADVVHFHVPLPSAVVAWQMIPKSMKKPYIVTYHSDIVRQAFLMPLYGPVLRRFLRGASRVMATSDRYLSTSPWLRDLNNAEVIPIGVDLERFSPSGTAVRDYYLFVGRFRLYKGIFVLLDAWRRMKDPPNLILAGGGALEGKVRDFIRDNHLPVEIQSNVSDDRLVALYRNAKALILPSIHRSEAYGMVQVEAMACGTPVISSDLPTGVPWVNRHGESGFTFRTGDPEQLLNAVLKMEKLSDQGSGMQIAARQRAERLFDSGELFKRVEECLFRAAES